MHIQQLILSPQATQAIHEPTRPWSHGIFRCSAAWRASAAAAARSPRPHPAGRCVAHGAPSAVLCSQGAAPRAMVKGLPYQTKLVETIDWGGEILERYIENMLKMILNNWSGDHCRLTVIRFLSVDVEVWKIHRTGLRSFFKSPQDSCLGERLPSRMEPMWFWVGLVEIVAVGVLNSSQMFLLIPRYQFSSGTVEQRGAFWFLGNASGRIIQS